MSLGIVTTVGKNVSRFKAGDKVFSRPRTSRIGTLAKFISVDAADVAHVITTASPRNFDLVRALGADEVIDYKTQKFHEVLKNVDVVFDTLGGDSLDQAFRVVR